MTFLDVLNYFRSDSLTEHEKGTRFERLMKAFFLNDPVYSKEFSQVWLWEEFPSKADFGNKDLGIDIVARTSIGEYCAIQCKFYAENTTIDADAVSHFIANASRTFTDPVNLQPQTIFTDLYWVSTSDKWGENAKEIIKGQQRPFNILSLYNLSQSTVDWELLLNEKPQKPESKKLLEHQKIALEKAHAHFAEHDRGRLIMACGTGKTFTSLRLVEQETGGKGMVLFLVPSISLLNQSLNAWMADTVSDMRAVCICSDPKASKQKDSDSSDGSSKDLALPSSTNANVIANRIKKYREQDALLVVFSTYQSIDAVHDAQKAAGATFDWIICDEAHRTTGVKFASKEEGDFTKIHNPDFILGRKRLYMTATPRIYKENAKKQAAENDGLLCSMDDVSLYGEEFYRVGFSYAVEHGMLTDYKVLVLTVDGERDLPDEVKAQAADPDNKELNFDAACKLLGCIQGLAKNMLGDGGVTWNDDPTIMRRALAFCPNINKKGDPQSSMNTAKQLPEVSKRVLQNAVETAKLLPAEEAYAASRQIKVEAKHIDGSMDSLERAQKLQWLQTDAIDPKECRVVCNVRCLAEGVDVPALDAVIFFNARASQVDVVQSVGRIMRNFRRGKPGEKKFGYIIIPVVVTPGTKPEELLDKTDFSAVWQILTALRSHDESFNAEINKISLNKLSSKKVVIGDPSRPHPFRKRKPVDELTQEEKEALELQFQEQMKRQMSLLKDAQGVIYGKLVEKVGDRMYWGKWAHDVGIVAQNFIARIKAMVAEPGEHQDKFRAFVQGLRDNINDSISEDQAIEMLAQHMVTKPVFDVLFADYQFSKNNPVSRSMEDMLSVLSASGMEKDMAVLDAFRISVQKELGGIDNLEGRQTIIKNLYDRFFKGAFPKTVEQLGIVYTPVECVDFILRSVNDILIREFGRSLTDEGVHILDPFTGTGTFITRLLQSGIIQPQDMERKYRHELHCNEIVLLAYYVADVNIESVFHAMTGRKEYLKYDNICLTDTFELAERDNSPMLCEVFKDNSASIARQRKTPIKVIVGNPPYSAKQKSANDDAQNLHYPRLDKRIEETYVAGVKTTNKNSLYDSYIRAFRWASDRIAKDGGVIGFITNGGWLDGNAAAGFRKCLEKEFSSIYMFHLRGDARTQGILRQKEGGGIFDAGSRAPVVITVLVRKPDYKGKARIHYCDIGDYLTREQKLDNIKKRRSMLSQQMEWTDIFPDEYGDWLTKRSGVFETFILLGEKNDKTKKDTIFEPVYCRGLETSRDAWVYNSSQAKLKASVKGCIRCYNEQCKIVKNGGEIIRDSTKFSWTRKSLKQATNNEQFEYDENNIRLSNYRPFYSQYVYFSAQLNEYTNNHRLFFPTLTQYNLLICASGLGGSKEHSVYLSNRIPDLNILDSGTQCFPLYYYEKKESAQGSLLDTGGPTYVRHDAITNWMLRTTRTQYNAPSITKEDIFYYVYGILHSPDYRARFTDDLKKSLPRIPLVEGIDTFMAFVKAGRKLAELHLNYEDAAPYAVNVIDTGGASDAHYRVEKMWFGGKGNDKDKSVIIYNGFIRIEGIPQEAYEYVVNGRSAIEWIMECYRIKTDKDSGITNDPNDWATEHGKPSYIFDLLLSVITVSVETMKIVKALPKLEFGE